MANALKGTSTVCFVWKVPTPEGVQALRNFFEFHFTYMQEKSYQQGPLELIQYTISESPEYDNDASWKDVKNSKTGELVYVAGQTRVKIFNDSISDGMNLDSFEAVVEEEGNWVMINSGFSIDGKVVPAREAMYSPGEILIKPNHGDERRYQLKDDAIKAFAAVAKHTRINNRDLELRKQNAAA